MAIKSSVKIALLKKAKVLLALLTITNSLSYWCHKTREKIISNTRITDRIWYYSENIR